MKLKLISFYCLFFAYFSAFGQNEISGIVKNEQNEAVFFATVALYNAADSSIVKAESTDENGHFKLTKIKDGNYYLEVSMLSFKTFQLDKIELPKDNGKSFELTLSEDSETLTTVEVTAKTPLLEQKSDRLVVNVENNMTSMNGNLLDVMKKVPGVFVIGDKLRMVGQQSVTILINGKTTKYMDLESLLRDMPGDNIKKVEVIHQPGAEFDADGTGAVINIILKKNSLFGTNGSITVGGAKGEDWKYKTRLQLSHYQGDVNIFGGIGYRRYPWWDEMSITRLVGEDLYEQVSNDPGASTSANGNLGLDWDITSRHRIGFSSRFWNSVSDNRIVNNTKIDFASEELDDLEIITENYQDDTWKMFATNPYYVFEIDTNGQKLDFDVNIVRIKTDGANTLDPVEQNFGFFMPDQRYEQPGTTKILTTSLNYKYPFSDALKLEIGGKYSDANLDNNLIALDENMDGDFIKNNLASNHFIFDETIAAAYSKITYGKNKWSGTLGLRYENSQSEGYSVTLDSTLTRDIAKVFPSFSLGREITKELSANIAYSYRIDRPRYSSLNPFVYFLDPFTSERGNPTLTPALTHSMKFNLAYEKQPFFNIEYKLTKDAMVEVTAQDDETGEANLSTVNLDAYKNLNMSLFFPLDFIPKISGYGGVIANYQKFDSEYLAQNFLRTKWDFTAFLQATFKLPAKIETEVTGWYNSGTMEGIVVSEWMYGVDIGFSKKFLDNKLRVSFGIDNIFARFLHANINYANMNLDLQNTWEGPVYNMQMSYKFGNQHLKSSKKHRGSASEELNRAAKN